MKKSLVLLLLMLTLLVLTLYVYYGFRNLVREDLEAYKSVIFLSKPGLDESKNNLIHDTQENEKDARTETDTKSTKNKKENEK